MRGVRAFALGFGLALGLLGAPAARARGEGEPVHVVQTGETLWRIAADELGDPHRWPEIYRANRDQIADPAVIFPGQRLRIPSEAPGGARPGRQRSPAVGETPR